MSINRLWWAAQICGICVLAGATAVAAEPDAWVADLVPPSGGVTLIRQPGNVPESARVGSVVGLDDLILTGEGSQVVLGFRQPPALVKVGRNTRSHVRTLRPEETVLDLLSGSVRVILQRAGIQPSAFRVEAIGLVAAARGTDFVVSRVQEEIEVTVLEGEVLVTYGGADVSTTEKRILLPGQAVSASSGQLSGVSTLSAPELRERIERATASVEEEMSALELPIPLPSSQKRWSWSLFNEERAVVVRDLGDGPHGTGPFELQVLVPSATDVSVIGIGGPP